MNICAKINVLDRYELPLQSVLSSDRQYSKYFQNYYFGTCTYILKRHNKGPIKDEWFQQKAPLFANLIKKMVIIEVPTYTYEPAVQLYGVDGIQQSMYFVLAC